MISATKRKYNNHTPVSTVFNSARRRRATDPRKKKKIHKVLHILRLRNLCRKMSYLTSQALVPSATSSWFRLDENGGYLNFMNTLGLTKDAFDDFRVTFNRYYVVLSGPGRPRRPTSLVEKLMVLSFILHMYASKQDLKPLCELFGCPPSTKARTLRKAEAALELSLRTCKMRQSDVHWQRSSIIGLLAKGSQ